MVTTNLNVEIDEQVYKDSKKRAIDLDITLKEYVEQSLKYKNEEIKNE